MAGEYPTTLADAMQQWAHIGQMQNQSRLMDVRARQAEQESQQEQQMRQLYQGGNRPTAEQLYSIDPRMGMEYEASQAKAQGQQVDVDLKKHQAISNLAADALRKLEAAGIQDPAQAEDFVKRYQASMKPYIQNVLGLPGNADMSLEQIKMLANSTSEQGAQDWITYNDAQQGGFMMNKKTGDVRPLEYQGKQLRPPQYDPALQGDIAAAKQRENIRDVTLSSGATVPARMGDVVNKGLPPTVAMDQAEEQALIHALNSPDPKLKAHAERRLTEMQGGATAATIGQTTEEKERIKRESDIQADQQKAEIAVKKDADMATGKKERQVGEVLRYLDTKIEGESLEDIIKQATGSKAGSMRDSAMRAVGETTPQSIAAAKLQSVAAWLTGAVPRFEGPQSDADRAYYQAMAADIGNPDVPAKEKIAKLQALKAILNANQKRQEKTIFDDAESIMGAQ